MTTIALAHFRLADGVVEAYRLDRYDNLEQWCCLPYRQVVEAYRLDRYDNDQHIGR